MIIDFILFILIDHRSWNYPRELRPKILAVIFGIMIISTMYYGYYHRCSDNIKYCD